MMTDRIKHLPFIGAASGLGGNKPGSEKAPSFLRDSLNLQLFQEIKPAFYECNPYKNIASFNLELAKAAFDLTKKKNFLLL